MSSIASCFARFFSRQGTKHHKSQPQNPPETANVEIQENVVRKSAERPQYVQHFSAEPASHFKTEQKLEENAASATHGDENPSDLTETVSVLSAAKVVTPIRNSEYPQDLSAHFPPEPQKPQFQYKLHEATVTEPLTISTNGAIESHLPSHSPSPTPSLETPSRHNSDASSNHSRAGSYASSTTGHWLKEQLQQARIECPEVGHSFLIPISVQEELITISNVRKDILARNPDIRETSAARYANDTCRYARKLYATLAYVKKGAEICQLLAEGMNDEDLPLVRTPNKKSKFALCRQNGQRVKALESWTDKSLEKFDRVQWWMTAPIFKSGERHKFEVNTILPFIPFEKDGETQQMRQGAYSKVYPVKIHPAHQEFYPEIQHEDDMPLFAVKQLFSSEKSEFLKEATILEALGPRNHPHLIKLLATYEKAATYHLVFPYANANLRKFWDDHPMPHFDRETALWVLKQMTGIASGIVLIHEFRVTHPLLVTGSSKSNFRNPGSVQLTVEKNEQWYGRHGDIKPENILWFSQGLKCPQRMGVLQIADFGLGRFHGRDSRSGVSKNVVSSPTYEPPECKLAQPVSRAYDIWSLGCLYLEFITWLLKGNLEIEGFSDARGRIPTGGDIDDDNFYTITTSNGTKDAIVREGVQSWVAELHAHEKCSQLIHNLLDLIMNELLVVDSKERSKATWLHSQLKIYLHKAERDDEYLLVPCPIPIPSPADDTKMTLELPTGRPKRSSVTFTPQEKPTRPSNHTHPKSQLITGFTEMKDLVGRAKGTPALSKIEHPRTWPER